MSGGNPTSQPALFAVAPAHLNLLATMADAFVRRQANRNVRFGFASFRLRVSKPSANRLTIRQRMRWRIERGEEIRLITAAQDD
jgi:hypothetical protein